MALSCRALAGRLLRASCAAPQTSMRAGTALECLLGDGFRLMLTGEFGAQYEILGSTNLLDWLPTGTVTNAYGTIQFTDPTTTNLPVRFYRALWVGP